jgi:hypothetical protein
VHVRQVQIEQNDVVIIQLAEIEDLLAKICRVHIETLGLQHQVDALGGGLIVLNQKNAHVVTPLKLPPDDARLSPYPPDAPLDQALTIAVIGDKG